MYEERRIRFDWLGFIIKVILLLIFCLVLFKLVPVTKTNSLADQIYNENLTTMKDAAKSYYTTDRLPKEIGQSETMTLQDMINNKMITEFVDKDGNYCDSFASYVTVTKTKDDEYVLKTQLACGTEVNYILETIGCYDVCVDCKVEEKVTEYEFKQPVKSVTQVKGCPAGYSLSGNACYKTINSNYTDAKVNYYENTTSVTDAKKTNGETVKTYIEKITTPAKTTYYCDGKVSSSATCTKNVTVTVPKTCKDVYVGVRTVRPCNSCAIVTIPVYEKQCTGGGTTTKTETYSAKVVTTDPTYSCPTGYTPEGSDSTLKCYTTTTSAGKEYCENSSATLKDGKCYLNQTGKFSHYSCPDNSYILSGAVCYKKSTQTAATTLVNKTITSYNYKWSTEKAIEGWTRTGNTRLVDADKKTTSEEYNELTNSIRTESDKELNDRITNISANTVKTSPKIGTIIIYVFIGLGILYLLFMFLSVLKPRRTVE